MTNNIIKEEKITTGVYRYTFESGDVIVTCGQTPKAVYDIAHKNHDKGGSTGNCYLNGELCSLKWAMEKIGVA